MDKDNNAIPEQDTAEMVDHPEENTSLTEENDPISDVPDSSSPDISDQASDLLAVNDGQKISDGSEMPLEGMPEEKADASEEKTDTPEEKADAPEEKTDTPVDEDETASFELRQPPEFSPKKYEENYYLLFGKKQVADCLDLEGTKKFLDQLGFDGGELSQARTKSEKAHEFEKREEGDGELICSYCNSKISGVDYYRLRDGRYRCTLCSRSIVKSVEQLEDIYKKIVKNMEILFDAFITTDIEISMADEITIKKKCKLSIGDIDNKSIMIFGVAIRDKDGYKIFIENSLPRIRAIATLVHELTHIWQYENWDKGKRPNRKKCIFKRKPKGGQLAGSRPLSDYEGMAKWSEIQYLYHIGETKVAEQEERITRGRNDEYGMGFIRYEREYPLQKKAMTKGKTPFTNYNGNVKGKELSK